MTVEKSGKEAGPEDVDANSKSARTRKPLRTKYNHYCIFMIIVILLLLLLVIGAGVAIYILVFMDMVNRCSHSQT